MGFFQKATLNQRFMTPVDVCTKSAVSQIPIYNFLYHYNTKIPRMQLHTGNNYLLN